MTNEELLLQVLGRAMEDYGVNITFAHMPQSDPAFWERLRAERESEAERALEAIAAALRRDTDDFTCVDEIIGILEPLGYQTVPRHDFG